MINRRDMIRGIASLPGLCAAGMGSSLLTSESSKASTTTEVSGPRRVVFFLQNQAFAPMTCVPQGMKQSGSLAKAKLPVPISPLEPYKDRLHIINGLHGLHCSPMHSAYFGALGGYRGGATTGPIGPTIDYVLSQALPTTIMPHLGIGMGSLEAMSSTPTIATLSASDVAKPSLCTPIPALVSETVWLSRHRQNA